MTRIALLSVVVALVVVLTPASVLAGYQVSPRLMAGQDTFVGVVQISGDPGGLTAHFMLRGGAGWCMTESAVHVVPVVAGDVDAALAQIPQNRNGNPIPGHFDYKADHDCVTDYVLSIPVDGLYGSELLFAIHAVVIGPEGQEETAWTINCGGTFGPQPLPGANWGFYALFPSGAWY
jgi:hypothetical protein